MLLEAKADAKESWARGQYTDSDPTVAGMKNAAAIGGIKVLDQILDMVESYRDLEN